MRDFTRLSSLVLYDNGAFELRYPGFTYRGAHAAVGDDITFFCWERMSAPGPWGAVGRLTGGMLAVRYTETMSHADFEDAQYRLMP